VRLQGDIYGFRAIQMNQYCVAALEKELAILFGLRLVLLYLGGSLRASREAVVRGVAPLGKGMPFLASRALRFLCPLGATAARLTVPTNFTLQEYQC